MSETTTDPASYVAWVRPAFEWLDSNWAEDRTWEDCRAGFLAVLDVRRDDLSTKPALAPLARLMDYIDSSCADDLQRRQVLGDSSRREEILAQYAHDRSGQTAPAGGPVDWVSDPQIGQLTELYGAEWAPSLIDELTARWGDGWEQYPSADKLGWLNQLLPTLELPFAAETTASPVAEAAPAVVDNLTVTSLGWLTSEQLAQLQALVPTRGDWRTWLPIQLDDWWSDWRQSDPAELVPWLDTWLPTLQPRAQPAAEMKPFEGGTLLDDAKAAKAAQQPVIEAFGEQRAAAAAAEQADLAARIGQALDTMRKAVAGLTTQRQRLYSVYRAPMEERLGDHPELRTLLQAIVDWMANVDAVLAQQPSGTAASGTELKAILDYNAELTILDRRSMKLETDLSEGETVGGRSVYDFLHTAETVATGMTVEVNAAVQAWADSKQVGGVLATKCNNVRNYGIAGVGSGWRNIKGAVYDWDKVKGTVGDYRVVGEVVEGTFQVKAVYSHSPKGKKAFECGEAVPGY